MAYYLKTEQEIRDWPQSALDKYWLGLETVSCRVSANAPG